MRAFHKLALALSGLAACAASAAEPAFVHLAEGYTSRDKQAGIVAAQRMFSAPSIAEICTPLESPARLVVTVAEPVRLVRGQWFSYGRLGVVAVDSSDRVLPPVPIALEVEEVTPELLNLRSDLTADPDGKVLPVRAGDFHFRLKTICQGHSAVVTIRARVVEP